VLDSRLRVKVNLLDAEILWNWGAFLQPRIYGNIDHF